jgi:hypothetical protein
MPGMGNELATMGSAVAGRGQFRCRRRSVAVAKVGRWLAFCTIDEGAPYLSAGRQMLNGYGWGLGWETQPRSRDGKFDGRCVVYSNANGVI